MKQTFKMKQTFNKFSLGILFVLGFGLLLIPKYYISAYAQALMEMNGGGGGGSYTPPSTPTTPTPPAVVYGSISLIVNTDKPSYIGSKNVTLSSSASVAVCSNTALDLKVTAKLVGPLNNPNVSSTEKDLGTLLDQHTVGGQVIAKNSTFAAPSASGSYKINLTADRYDASGYVLMTNGYAQSGSNGFIVRNDYGSAFYVSTNYRGRITGVSYTYGGSDVGVYSLLYGFPLTDENGAAVSVVNVDEEVIKNYTTSIDINIDPVTVNVGKTSEAAIPSGSIDTITWDSTNATHCNTCKMNDPVNGPNCPNFTPGLTGSFKTTQLTSTTTYYIKCDNLP